MSEVICLSSSDEELAPPKKKPKPVLVLNLKGITITPIKKTKKPHTKENKAEVQVKDSTIVLSDDDGIIADESEDCQIISEKPSENHEHSQDECEIIEDDSIDKLKIKEVIQNNLEDNITGKENISDNVILCSRYNSGNESEKLKDDANANENTVKPTVSPASSETKNSEGAIVAETPSIPSTSKSANLDCKSSQTILLEEFVRVCEEKVKKSDYEKTLTSKCPILWQYYKKCGPKLEDNPNFQDLLMDNTKRAQGSAAKSLISFSEVYKFIKETVDAESLEVSDTLHIKLKKLEKTIKRLTRKIKQLEETEVNFDDEEDSTYIQFDRYTNRLNKVYNKYCQYLKKNPYSGRLTYAKLDFVDSEYNEINRAINKKYKRNQKFPNYYEMERDIKKVVAEYKLPLTEIEIKTQSTKCFKKLGELLKIRRQRELYDAHYQFIRDGDDPAAKDPSLNSTLSDNYTLGQTKLEQIFQNYANKQEFGEEAPTESEDDSDKSSYVDSADESDDKEKQKIETKDAKEDVHVGVS